jgi:hypothetical protein
MDTHFVRIQEVIDTAFVVYDHDRSVELSSWKHYDDADTARLELLAEEPRELDVIDRLEEMF